MHQHRDDEHRNDEHRHQHDERRHQGPTPHTAHDDATLADLLDLDACVLRPTLDEVVAWSVARATAGGRPVRTVVDLGAGTGSGTLALARALPEAQVVAVDVSPVMLDRLESAARAAGVGDRVRTVRADLDAGLPAEVAGADLVWAASSLHHVADPARLLREVAGALRPGGTLVVVEMDDRPWFLPSHGQHAVLERDLHAAADAQHHNAHPDWTADIAAAGLGPVVTAGFRVRTDASPDELLAWAHLQLTRLRQGLGDGLDDDGRALLDALLDDEDARALTAADLDVRGSRTAWAATAPDEPAGAPADVDVLVVGGGAAGLAAAVVLGRSRRSVLVVDGGEQRNAPAHGVHNLLGREGVAPHDLVAAGRTEARALGVAVVDGEVRGARRRGEDLSDGFDVDLVVRPSGATGTTGPTGAAGATSTIHARRIVLATGLVDELPDVPGLREHWGTRVLHCPYCHGWEVRDRRLVVLGTGDGSYHQALLFRQLTPHVTVVRHAMPPLDDERAATLAALGVEVVDGPVLRLDPVVAAGATAALTVVLADDRTLPADAVVVAPRFVPRADLYLSLGGTLVDHPMGAQHVPTGPQGQTDVPGVVAAGNVADLAATVAVAAAAGQTAGAGLNADLVEEDAARAVQAWRGRGSHAPAVAHAVTTTA
ncbi:FAD-dependent oxidoreductase [Cellulomonas marina]|uniref:Thioredoxin reductase n=1 Tax=Cellulomonas marina TaxID=988821 RepID=A0A1I0Z3Q7_9CELL|nr:FAD-dependent oxidoreductase [Cellulomonas marina]SFB20244.1 Thioredoxin reductase [Cellulomonas marina]